MCVFLGVCRVLWWDARFETTESECSVLIWSKEMTPNVIITRHSCAVVYLYSRVIIQCSNVNSNIRAICRLEHNRKSRFGELGDMQTHTNTNRPENSYGNSLQRQRRVYTNGTHTVDWLRWTPEHVNRAVIKCVHNRKITAHTLAHPFSHTHTRTRARTRRSAQRA